MLARRRALHAEQGERQYDDDARQQVHVGRGEHALSGVEWYRPIITQPRGWSRQAHRKNKTPPGVGPAGFVCGTQTLVRAYMFSIILCKSPRNARQISS